LLRIPQISSSPVTISSFFKHLSITPYIGDMHVSLLNDICKFQVPIIYQQTQILYTDQGRSNPMPDGPSQRDGNKVDEKQVQRNYFKSQEMMRSYFTFIVHYWQILKNGDVALILQRPSKSLTSVTPYTQESELLKQLIAKSEYKSIAPKYNAMTPAEFLEHFNKRDDSFMEIKFQSAAKGFVNKQGINDQYLFDNEYIVNEEECFKLRGHDTRLLNYEILEQLFDNGFDPFV
jgi:mRNA-degrading endonuclease HigB of HigAB toxin-antitoxin module